MADGLELTDPQRRTLEQLIGTDARPSFPADLPQRLRDRIEEAVRELELREPLWLGKEKLNDHGRARGSSVRRSRGVAAVRALGEERGRRAAAQGRRGRGGRRDALDAHAIAEMAADRLLDREDRFHEYWRGRSPPSRTTC